MGGGEGREKGYSAPHAANFADAPAAAKRSSVFTHDFTPDHTHFYGAQFPVCNGPLCLAMHCFSFFQSALRFFNLIRRDSGGRDRCSYVTKLSHQLLKTI